jgi:transcriptional regulator with PAS, ATPase and Fis domain
MMLHAGRPELIATGLVAILADAGGVVSAAAVSRAADGEPETLAACGASPEPADKTGLTERTFQIGSARNRAVEVTVTIRPDLEAIATVNAVTLLLGTIRDLERGHAEREERLTLWPLEDPPPDGEQAIIMGRMSEVMSFARRVARTNVSVLITGESGTGKEILARAIHRYSARAEKPFVPFNCAAIPREMLESQLFGHRRGAFTGAERDSPGVIRAARGGTLLLDEIGELGPELQPKLLRFLESGEISPLGEPAPLTVDVRIVAATNANLEQLVQEGRFREDLFYRLNVIRLTIPPLRERRDEIPALVHHFAGRAAQEFGKGRVRVAEETMEQLLLYPWPGNVRQLNNELRRMVALAEPDATLTPSALSQDILRATPSAHAQNSAEIAVTLTEKLIPALSRIEREMIKAALTTNAGKVDAAARALGISRKGLYLKRQRLGL